MQAPISVTLATDEAAEDEKCEAVPLPIATSPKVASTPILSLALTVQETAHALRFDPRTIRAMVRSGELDGNQKGHAIRISRSSVVDWLRGKRRAPRSKR